MRYLYTDKPDEGCHEVSPGVYGRPVRSDLLANKLKAGWKIDPNHVAAEIEEREAADRRELELKLAAGKAEKDRLAAEQAKRDAEERAAKAAEKAAEAAEIERLKAEEAAAIKKAEEDAKTNSEKPEAKTLTMPKKAKND